MECKTRAFRRPPFGPQPPGEGRPGGFQFFTVSNLVPFGAAGGGSYKSYLGFRVLGVEGLGVWVKVPT